MPRALEMEERIGEQNHSRAVVGMKVNLQPRVAEDARCTRPMIEESLGVAPESAIGLTRLPLPRHQHVAMLHVRRHRDGRGRGGQRHQAARCDEAASPGGTRAHPTVTSDQRGCHDDQA